MPKSASALQRRILAVIARVPRGRVATYSQVAEVAGIPRGGRVTAAALRRAGKQVPWHRIIGVSSPSRGRIAILDPVGAAIQRGLLEKEAVIVDERGQIDLTRFGWRPRGRV